jgi:hypothetical protein
MNEISGYDYGTSAAAHSPVTPDELRALEATVGSISEDRAALEMAGAILRDQAETMVDSWRAEIAQQPHLGKWFFGPTANQTKLTRQPSRDALCSG